MKNFNTVEESVEQYVAGVEKKAKLSNGKLFGRAIFAGAMIAFGAAASSVAAHGISDVGTARVMAGLVFPVGLMMVILLGAELFTGDCMLFLGVPQKTISIPKVCKMLAIIYIGNFVGGALIAFFTWCSGQYDFSAGGLGAYTIKVAVGKVNLSALNEVSSGILCNILVCGAVIMALCATDIMGKLFASFFVIFAFVVAGFEHCVANMYYITAGILCKNNYEYVSLAMEKYGLSQSQIDSLNVSNFLAGNLLHVTIGNIIGGALLFGLPLYYLTIYKPSLKKEVVQEERNHDGIAVHREPNVGC